MAQVHACVETYAMLSPGETVLVAVSGGADSMALLWALWQLRSSYSLTLVVVHVNHQVRGVASTRDALFVEQQAQRLSLPSYQARVDVQALRRHTDLSPQAAARQLRYQCLATLTRRLGATRAALGHTADDQAETLLLRLLRGGGPSALAGIPAVRGPFIRPLLEVTRQDIQKYLRQERVAWIEDASNAQRTYLRNRVRLDLLPALRAYNPKVTQRLHEVTAMLRAEQQLLEAQDAACLPPLLAGQDAQHPRIRCLAFQHAPLARQRRLLHRVTGALLETPDALGFRHLEALRYFLLEGTRGQRRVFPGHLVAVHEGETVLLCNGDAVPAMPRTLLLPVPGRVAIPTLHCQIQATIIPPPARPHTTDPSEAFVDGDVVDGPLTVRFWQPGDRFAPLGTPGTKKLHDFFIDQKIPRAARPYVPLVLSRQRIVWVVGHRIAEECKLRASTRRVVALRHQRFDPPQGNDVLTARCHVACGV